MWFPKVTFDAVCLQYNEEAELVKPFILADHSSIVVLRLYHKKKEIIIM